MVSIYVLCFIVLVAAIIEWLLLKGHYNQKSQFHFQKIAELKQNHEQSLNEKSIEHNRLVSELKENHEKMLGYQREGHESLLRIKQEETDKAAAELKSTIEKLNQDIKDSFASAEGYRIDAISLIQENAELKTRLSEQVQKYQEQIELLNQAKEQMKQEFENLAQKIFEEKGKTFAEQNKTNLDLVLNPFRQQITDFKQKVEEVYTNEGKDRSALSEQVKQLIQLNNALSQDAQNLTLALKGDRKAQGNWGEIILDDVLEKAGLCAGQHYERQGSVKSEDGQSHVIPDVVIHLPGDRHLVVDSKMTLPDYRAFASAENEDERVAALKRHQTSIRNHIKVLSEKNYQSLYGLKSLDFVVMFIPLEPAFMLAVTNDCELFQQAWDKNVLLVSPSTLLFVVRTVAYLWRQEDLSRNAKEISNRGAELYDKLVGFVADLQKVGGHIQQAQDSYNEARKKFSEGKGNVIIQAQKLKSLGVKPSKSLPLQWVEAAIEESQE
ncbi:MAG: DNA recombination protein RmuC [bacterium]